MTYTAIVIFVLPILSIMTMLKYKNQYYTAINEEEKKIVKKKYKIAIIINVILVVVYAILLAVFIYWVKALGNMT